MSYFIKREDGVPQLATILGEDGYEDTGNIRESLEFKKVWKELNEEEYSSILAKINSDPFGKMKEGEFVNEPSEEMEARKSSVALATSPVGNVFDQKILDALNRLKDAGHI